MKTFLIILFCLFTHLIIAQHGVDSIKPIKYFNADQIIYELNNNYWLNAPSGTEINPISLSSNAYLMFPFIGKSSNLSIAVGVGVSSGSIRYNSNIVEQEGISFLSTISDTIDVKHNKIVTTYIEAPLEFRYMTLPNIKGRSFRFTLGFKSGYLIGKHIKYLGEDQEGSGDYIKVKYYKIKNILPYRLGVFSRIGFGKFAVTGYYSLTTLFDKNNGPQITPFNIGLTLILF
jgi:hypothetical protein